MSGQYDMFPIVPAEYPLSYEEIAEHGPNETKFNQMELVASSDGPTSNGRRTEMNRWADAQGALAEGATRLHAETEVYYRDSKDTFAEEPQDAIVRTNEEIAKDGVELDGDGEFVNASRVYRAIKEGVAIVHLGRVQEVNEVLRSPRFVRTSMPEVDALRGF
ncbi:MAG TPA: hypothetical protein VJC09_00355 [Candidatus Saccharimonadales bacterium]|nr:hypothetical protein [Candidatus Saccharimonadales bacterium]